MQTLSAREIEREGWKIEIEDPTGGLIEPVDPKTGQKMPARLLMPDPGWEKNAAAEAWAPDLSKYEPALKKAVKAEIGTFLKKPGR